MRESEIWLWEKALRLQERRRPEKKFMFIAYDMQKTMQENAV